jgi:protein kinase A
VSILFSPFQQSLRITSCVEDDFEMGRIVGTGSFGRVCLARHKTTDTVVAIKSFLKANIVKNQQTDHLISEKNVLEILDHPFIVKMHTTFQDQQCIHFVFEFIAGGEFFSHLRSRGQLCEEAARFYAAEVLLVFEYLHSKDIVYRDLKVR